RDDVPRAQVVAVIAAPWRAGLLAVVGVVRRRRAAVVVVVPGRRTGARLVSAPRGIVAVGERARPPTRVRVVPGGEHGARNPVQQGRGRLRSARAAVRDVARADQDCRRAGGWGRWRRGCRAGQGGVVLAPEYGHAG